MTIEFGIDLSRDRVVLEMLKSNPKLESGKDNDGSIFFRFRAKLIIRNKMELKQTLTRSDVGVLMSDIEDCYPGIRTIIHFSRVYVIIEFDFSIFV